METKIEKAQSGNKASITSITVIRFFLAMWVVQHHFVLHELTSPPLALKHIAQAGVSAVGFFYMISGFVLFYGYHDRVEIDYGRFVYARFCRIYPVYFIALAWLIFSVYGLPPWPESIFGDAFLQIFLLQSWFPTHACALNCPGWSLSNEVVFYALFPLLLVLFNRPFSRRGLAVGLLLGWLATLIAPSLVLVVGASESSLQWATYNPLTNLAMFINGIMVAKLHLGAGHLGTGEGGFRLPYPGVVLVALAGLVIGLTAAEAGVFLIYIHLGILAPIYGGMLLGAAQSIFFQGLAQRLTVMVLLGEASYAVYILQIPVWVTVKKMAAAADPALLDNRPLIFTLTVVTLIAVSTLLHVFFERPARRVLLRLWR